MIRFIQDHGTVLDGIGVTLCLLIIGYLICNRGRYGRMIRRVEQKQDFADHVVRSMVSQQIRGVLMAVMEKVDSELHLLDAGTSDPMPGDRPLPAHAGSQRAASIPWAAGNPGKPASVDPREEPVSAVSRLVEAGMGIADISRSVRRPVAEVELCAWLGRHRSGRQKEPATGRSVCTTTPMMSSFVSSPGHPRTSM